MSPKPLLGEKNRDGRPPRKKVGIGKFTDTVYLTKDDIIFYITKGKLLGAKIKDYDGRVNIFRAFPFSQNNKYLSVRDSDLNELGIIEDLDTFEINQISLVMEELSRRYFVPEITKVIDAKEEFGNFFWHVETTSGERKFSMRDLANNLIRLPENKIILIDVDGSRYLLNNPAKNAGKAIKFLDIWI